MIELRRITPDNFWDVIELEVATEQQELVVSNAVSIAQAYVQPECIPLAVYEEEKPVGFVMYCIDRDDGEYWLYRLMIDWRHQGRGLGKMALSLVLGEIKKDAAHHKVYLGVDRRGEGAVGLYESAGFRFTGQVFGKESIMCLEY